MLYNCTVLRCFQDCIYCFIHCFHNKLKWNTRNIWGGVSMEQRKKNDTYDNNSYWKLLLSVFSTVFRIIFLFYLNFIEMFVYLDYYRLDITYILNKYCIMLENIEYFLTVRFYAISWYFDDQFAKSFLSSYFIRVFSRYIDTLLPSSYAQSFFFFFYAIQFVCNFLYTHLTDAWLISSKTISFNSNWCKALIVFKIFICIVYWKQ